MCSTPKNSGLANRVRRVNETSIDYKLLKQASNLADQREREREKNRALAAKIADQDPDATADATVTAVLKKRKLTACQHKQGMARFLQWLRPFYT